MIQMHEKDADNEIHTLAIADAGLGGHTGTGTQTRTVGEMVGSIVHEGRGGMGLLMAGELTWNT